MVGVRQVLCGYCAGHGRGRRCGCAFRCELHIFNAGQRVGAVGTAILVRHRRRIAAGADRVVADLAGVIDDVVTVTTPDGVVAAMSLELVGKIVAGDVVIAVSAHGGFNQGAGRNADIVLAGVDGPAVMRGIIAVRRRSLRIQGREPALDL